MLHSFLTSALSDLKESQTDSVTTLCYGDHSVHSCVWFVRTHIRRPKWCMMKIWGIIQSWVTNWVSIVDTGCWTHLPAEAGEITDMVSPRDLNDHRTLCWQEGQSELKQMRQDVELGNLVSPILVRCLGTPQCATLQLYFPHSLYFSLTVGITPLPSSPFKT